MSIYFQYDVMKLITYIKDRPCLWDKSLVSYRDSIKRRLAWQEVFNLLEPRYKANSTKEKKVTEEHVVNKWTNIRDAFVKSLRHKDGKPKRKYKYYKELEFLLKGAPDLTQSYEADYRSTDYAIDLVPYTAIKIKNETDIEKTTCILKYGNCKGSENKDSSDKGSDFNFVEVDETGEPRIMNEDEAFFASLLPSVVRYTEDERLEFRIEVLAIMRRIKTNRNWSSHT